MSAAAVRLCRQCRRVNPPEATYCHHDGVHLGAGAGAGALDAGSRPFPAPFVLPGGRACRNFNELALACHADPKAALDVLRAGHLETFLAAQGRGDLARAARTAARSADRLRGLDDFLGRLPAANLRPPRLRVEPAALELGTLRPGEDRRAELTLVNEGMRLLTGAAGCNVPWLSLAEGAELQSKLFECTGRTVVPVRVVGRQLRAMEKPQEALILVESNGGSVTVPVRVHVPVKPFPEGALSGALSPRAAAHKAKDSPREAAILIESGALRRWYESNGWTYPVLGPSATGVAAVQQFLEALGLVKPPRVEVSEDAVRLRGRPGERVEYSLAVVTQENRAALAFGSSDQPWLVVGPSLFRGRSAFLPLNVPAVPGKAGDTLHAVVSITANGGQRFTIPVTLTVGERPPARAPAPPAAPRPPVVPVPVAVAAPAAVPVAVVAPPAAIPVAVPAPPAAIPVAVAAEPAAPAVPTVALAPGPRPAVGSALLMLIAAALLFVLVGGAALRDALAPPPTAASRSEVPPDPVPRLELRFHDEPQDDELEELWLPGRKPTMRFGVVMLRDGREVGEGARLMRLTFDPWGRTNNTCLRFDALADHDERLFGGPGGSWEDRYAKSWKDDRGDEHEGGRSVWVCDDKQIAVTQFVELVRGEQSRLLDTCRVRYRIENRDAREHQVGVRFLLDSFIGGNDGVPFTIPGDSELCDTMKDLPSQAKDKKLPDFLQALERADLGRPGTVAHVRLKLEELEAPERVTLGAWPNEKLRVLDRGASGPATLWAVPLLPMNSLGLRDSAVTIYWADRALAPGATREVGFEYGLWPLVNQGKQLALTADGAFRPDGELTVVAYVDRSDAVGDETATLTLPEGFQLLEGELTQAVPSLAKGAKTSNSPVTWKVRAGPVGKYELTVKTSSGASQTVPVEIRKGVF
jgi:hypothetical protein